MPRLFVANVTFEHELLPHRQTLPKRLLRLCSELVGMWLAIADDGDWIWCPEPVEAEFWSRMEERRCPHIHPCGPSSPPPAGLEMVPWGWSESMRALAESLQARVSAPPQSAVKLTNSRRFSFSAETNWNCGLGAAAVVASVEDLEKALDALPPNSAWVLKCEHGAAARERIIGQRPPPTPQALAWIRSRLSNDARLYFEPWVDRISEAGLQWSIPAAGTPELVGVTPLLCEQIGRYLGSQYATGTVFQDEWADAIDLSRRAAECVQHTGYFGPLGIDAMRYRDANGEARVRPLQDINARWTMGRIALGWRRVTRSGTWRHGTAGDMAAASVRRNVIRTSPLSVGGRPVEHCTWIEPG
jgi:hypothetical protein